MWNAQNFLHWHIHQSAMACNKLKRYWKWLWLVQKQTKKNNEKIIRHVMTYLSNMKPKNQPTAKKKNQQQIDLDEKAAHYEKLQGLT